MSEKANEIRKTLANPANAPDIGKTIQRLRQAYKLSLGDLAEQSGVSKSIISQIERNESNPTLATIWRLSTALETTIENVLKNDSHTGIIENIATHLTPILKSEDGLCTLRVLNPINTVDWVQWYEFIAEPRGVLESSSHEIGTIEHMTVLEGNIQIISNGEKTSVKTGATARYRADVDHSIGNVSHGAQARAMLIVILKSSVLQ